MLTTLCRVLALRPRELILLVAIVALSLPAVTSRIYASDEIQYFSYLRSLWFDRDVSFENEYRYFYDRGIGRGEGFHATFLELQTATGRRPNFGTIGSAILWAPFYAVADGTARLMRAAGRPVALDGFSGPYVAAVAYGSAFYGFLAVVLSAGAVRRVLTNPDVSGGGVGAIRREVRPLTPALLVWFGTPLIFYMYVAPPYAHACSAFAVALFVTVWLHVRRVWSPRGAIVLGLAAALMAMVREQDALLAAGPALDFLLDRWKASATSARGRLAIATAGCGALLVGLLPQLLAYQALNGRPLPSTLVTRKMTWYAPHALEVLASPAHGFLLWTPLAALAIAGLIVLAARGMQDARRIALCGLLMVALQVYVSGSVESWTVAGAFGQRRFVALTVLLTIGVAGLLHAVRATPWRVPAVAGVAICVWWNLALVAQFGTGMMDRQRLDLRLNAYHAFVTLPRTAPSLAWRYLTDRQSFYATDGHGPEAHRRAQDAMTDSRGRARRGR